LGRRRIAIARKNRRPREIASGYRVDARKVFPDTPDGGARLAAIVADV
jgi:hypothetical protein